MRHKMRHNKRGNRAEGRVVYLDQPNLSRQILDRCSIPFSKKGAIDKIIEDTIQKTRLKPMTPSLANFLYSLLAGAIIIVIPATIALVIISQRDKVQRS